ncbi:MAG: hypothetical protein HQM16_19385 [Deltaproteobacteria bacterium]|nr:hypothetical protein [Deltaproteobacteria bacterium]
MSPDKAEYKDTVNLEKLKTGKLFVGATPWAEVTIAGFAGNREIPFTIDLPQGNHRVVARYQDSAGKWHRVSGSVTIKPDGAHKCLASFGERDGMRCW